MTDVFRIGFAVVVALAASWYVANAMSEFGNAFDEARERGYYDGR